ncbi:zinc-binding dehydrogenase [Xylophilus sp. Kf1]|nr:zinc-binding dehydrogenase [Xylophilus sp. Kf1]
MLNTYRGAEDAGPDGPPPARSFRIEAFGQPLVAHHAEVRPPEGRELLLRTRHCGVCHSDLHLADGYFDMGHGRRLDLAQLDILPPITPGHEVVAELVAAGPRADMTGLAFGRRYLVFPWVGCGRCGPCRKGQGNLCLVPRAIGVQRVGGYSDTVTVPEARYLLDIEGLEPAAAATLACSGLTAYSALRKAQGARDEWLALIGMGGVGSAALQVARGLGYERIAAVDLDAGKLDWALAQGAQLAVDARAADAPARLRSGTGGVETVIDFVGSSDSARLGLDALQRGGSYILVGMFGGDIDLPLPLLATRALTVRGSYTGTLEELHELTSLVKSGHIALNPVEAVAPDQVNAALDRLRRGQAGLRQVLAYD